VRASALNFGGGSEGENARGSPTAANAVGDAAGRAAAWRSAAVLGGEVRARSGE
jgi:hypothetical protein